MFSIHGLINDYYIPFAFFFTPADKETQTYYIKAFTHLNEEFSKLELIFSPDTVFTDFEVKVDITAIQIVRTEFKTRRCRFHLAQSW